MPVYKHYTVPGGKCKAFRNVSLQKNHLFSKKSPFASLSRLAKEEKL
jgi:hypothetical protein